MPYVAFDGFHTTIASIVSGIGKVTFDLTSASGFPALSAGDFTILRIDDGGTPEDVLVTARSGVTCTCLPTTVSHAAGNTVDGAILDAANAFPQIKDDVISGFPVNALSAGGALAKGVARRNHITAAAADTYTLANGAYKGELCRVSVDPTSVGQVTVDPASTTTWDGFLTIALFAGDVIIGAWDGVGWITLHKYSVPQPFNKYIAGNYYYGAELALVQIAVGSSTVTRYHPFYISSPITISELGAYLTTGSAGGKMRLGIYANGANNQPTGPVLADSGDLSTSSFAIVTGVLASNVQLLPGLYWCALQMDNPTARVLGVGANYSYAAARVGVATLSDLAVLSAGTTSSPLWTATSTYGTFATNPAVSEGAGTATSGPNPIFKVASVP